MRNQSEFVLSILKRLDIFSDIDAHALEELSLLFEERIFNQGEIIFEESSIIYYHLIIVLKCDI